LIEIKCEKKRSLVDREIIYQLFVTEKRCVIKFIFLFFERCVIKFIKKRKYVLRKYEFISGLK